jgi:hypothetical protein
LNGRHKGKRANGITVTSTANLPLISVDVLMHFIFTKEKQQEE